MSDSLPTGPDVSVVIPVYNGAATIRACVASVLAAGTSGDIALGMTLDHIEVAPD